MNNNKLATRPSYSAQTRRPQKFSDLSEALFYYGRIWKKWLKKCLSTQLTPRKLEL
jgi:hypothetical protein